MLFEDPARRYPHLKQALNLLGMRRFEPPVRILPLALGIAGLFGAGIVGVTSHLADAVLATIVGTAILVGGVIRRSPPKTAAVDIRAQEATDVAKRMVAMLAKRRLHRDLDSSSLLLMDECARYWLRAKEALDRPFWTSGQASFAYQGLRSQAESALDSAMDDVLLHYRAHIPEHVDHRNPIDYVDEALEQFTFRSKDRGVDFPPPEFAHVRLIADKLRELAEEVERLGRDIQNDPLFAEEMTPRTSLDETLSELREIRQAEEELGQNLRG